MIVWTSEFEASFAYWESRLVLVIEILESENFQFGTYEFNDSIFNFKNRTVDSEIQIL